MRRTGRAAYFVDRIQARSAASLLVRIAAATASARAFAADPPDLVFVVRTASDLGAIARDPADFRAEEG